ncbi:SOS response-associated peptidase [bacterium]|nr:SOS response-associated peptidase [bacterium]
MTGRFFRREIPWAEYTAATGLVPPAGVGPPEAQWNIAPTQAAPVFRRSWPGVYTGEYAPSGALSVTPAFWGLVPTWWTKPLKEKTFTSFTARAETAATSTAFSGAYRHGRCLVPASGYYVWAGAKGRATPFAVTLRERDWFCFAGLWARPMIEGSELDTFAIVTTEANDMLAGLATSMPVILDEAGVRRWLDGSEAQVAAVLKPYPEDEMQMRPAHPSVGDVRNHGPELTGGS